MFESATPRTKFGGFSHRLVRRHLTIGLNAVLEAVQLPARVARLDAGLADVEIDYLTHIVVRKTWSERA